MKRAVCNLTQLTVEVAREFVSRNPTKIDELPQLIRTIHTALSEVNKTPGSNEVPVPTVPVAESVTREHIVCLYDGMRLKTLKRHLRHTHSLSPEQYRLHWDLPPDYPMVAPAYAELRTALAKRTANKR